MSCGLIHGRQIHRAISIGAISSTREAEAKAKALAPALVELTALAAMAALSALSALSALASCGGGDKDVLGVVDLSSPSSPGCSDDSETVRARLRYLNNDCYNLVLFWK